MKPDHSTESREIDPNYWVECHLPAVVASYLAERCRNTTPRALRVIERGRRFRSFWERHPEEDDQLRRQWRILEKFAISEDHLLTLFLTTPDTAQRNPFPLLTGIRKHGTKDISFKEERKQYKKLAKKTCEIRTFLFSSGADNFRNLLSDASATGGDAAKEAQAFQASNGHLRMALFHLEKMLLLADPAAKYPYGQPDSPDAATQAYVAVLASLNSHLTSPQHSAIAYLAQVNNPLTAVTNAALGAAFRGALTKTSKNNSL
ncbi:hypothetical protein [Burkholderia sp. A1]|uniref:hypothetical protein n=1 Tax=Burkholderia sp. A1 TaxID=148446 RepID=UPI001268BC63|nr:hypothetical protein [Burkholderia sp. A1]